MIKLSNIKKYYDKHRAVEEMSFTVKKGEILGFLGPNGAGKSTTMKMLTSFISPTAGDAWIDGYSVVSQSIKTRALIGYLPESAPTYKDMRVREFLDFVGQMRGFSSNDRNKRIKKVAEETFLGPVFNQTIDTLSKGFRQRVGLAQALLHDPEVLILDEPTDGLDPNQKMIVRQLIKRISQEKTIILSTHILEEMEAVCTRALIIDQGEIVADGLTDELLKMADNYNAVVLVVAGEIDDDVGKLFASMPKADKIEIDKESKKVIIYPKDKAPILELVLDKVRNSNLKIASVHVEKSHMDLVFRSLTKREEGLS
ncbi:MAG: ATP-binding cassette domain-containing protein [SAR324 cluster bacterium]|nr:ATP-binding cassette domain-containing protein [SAR324 cluster bacterium]